MSESKKWKFFKDPKKKRTYFSIMKGESVFDIAEREKMRFSTMKRTLASPYMLEALDDWLSLKAFDYEMKKRKLKMEALKSLEKKFKDVVETANPNVVLRSYLELLIEKEKDPKNVFVSLTKIMNNFVKSNVGRPPDEEKKARALEEEFGYEQLEQPTNEDSSMDKGESSKDKQEETNRV